MRSSSSRRTFVGVALAALLASCAPGPNELVGVPDAHGQVAGFWLGVWHGAIVPITFLVSLFTPDVQPYDVHHSGGWYNFGFLLGATMALGGGGHASRRRRGDVQVTTPG